MGHARWPRFFSVGLAAVVVVSTGALVAANVLLVRRNRVLNVELRTANKSLLPPIGRAVPPLRGFDMAGHPLSVEYGHDARPTLLFVFSRSCAYCTQAWPEWEQIRAHMDTRKVRVVFVNIGAGFDRDFAFEHHLGDAIAFRQIDPGTMVSYNFLLTPDIVEVDGAGVVRNAWVGVLDAPAEALLSKIVSGRLPQRRPAS